MKKTIGFQFKQVHDIFEASANNKFIAYDLTLSQVVVLRYLIEHQSGEITQKDLEEYLNLKHSTVSGILKRMEKKGLLEVFVNPRDRRSRIIIPTTKAQEAFMVIQSHMDSMNQKITRGFTESEKKVLGQLLERVIQNISSDAN